MAAAEAMETQGALRTVKDLGSGAVGGFAQVLLGQPFGITSSLARCWFLDLMHQYRYREGPPSNDDPVLQCARMCHEHPEEGGPISILQRNIDTADRNRCLCMSIGSLLSLPVSCSRLI